MPAMIAVAGISAAASMYGAHKAANAAKEAAKTQVASADKAQGFNQRVYDDQRANMAPYVQGGQSAFGQLLNGWQSRQPGGAPQASAPSGPSLQPPAGGPSPFARAMPGAPQGAPMSGPPAGGQMVTLRAPDGSTQQVPAHLAQQFVAKGAQVVQ